MTRLLNFSSKSAARIDERDCLSVISNDCSELLGPNSDIANEGSTCHLDPMLDAKQKTKAVVRLRLIVGSVLLCSAAILAVSVYYYLSLSEYNQFQRQWREDSHKILEAVGNSFDKTLGLMDEIAVSFLSIARATNQTWPFVTMPDFAVRMKKVLPLTDGFVVSMLPVVRVAQRKQWEAYALKHDSWVNEGMSVQDNWEEGYYGPVVYDGVSDGVIHSTFGDLPYNESRDYLPLWQNFPVIANTSYTYNWDWLSVEYPKSFVHAIANRTAIMAEAYMLPDPGEPMKEAETEEWASYFSAYVAPSESDTIVQPVSDFVYPIVDDTIDRAKGRHRKGSRATNSSTVGLIAVTLYWRRVIRNILPEGSLGIVMVFSMCGANFSYRIDGPNATYLGPDDFHDSSYDHLRVNSSKEFSVRNPLYSGAPVDSQYCDYMLNLYPSNVTEAQYITPDRIIFTVTVIFLFAFTSLVFCIYDITVERRQQSVLTNAVRSSNIVSSLFPSTVRARLYPTPEISSRRVGKSTKDEGYTINTAPNDEHGAHHDGSPIAELYPETTVLFADIVGFTSWSATRQPTQVFLLLETLYAAFDKIAKRRGVFKVETIGDCYVAVTGLPTPRKSHALVMARFANDCRRKMHELTVELERSLGPGTADLALRIGMNSGPTTAGVLRGEKSRFQLFGDTVNTASRMESNGARNRIHVSQATAELIGSAGKSHWLSIRDETIEFKGKGKMTTFWLEPNAATESATESDLQDCECPPVTTSTSLDAFVDWNTATILELLQSVVWQRDIANDSTDKEAESSRHESPSLLICPFGAAQLREYVFEISKLYRTHEFHNFEHASHVVMTTSMLLKKMRDHGPESSVAHNCALLDPLTHFALVFAALIHDVDHPGVSNAQLVSEQDALSVEYGGLSVAEQHSLDVAWGLLLEPQFAQLRECLFATNAEQEQFRQVVVNAVLATDLFDKELNARREVQWQKHFGGATTTSIWEGRDGKGDDQIKLDAIADLVLRAADVSHTMQHYVIYRKWNSRLLAEMYKAFASGRAAQDPTIGWYEGELWFFDHYVIPLAAKLCTTELFGTASGDFLQYARDNRAEWELCGRCIVNEIVSQFK